MPYTLITSIGDLAITRKPPPGITVPGGNVKSISPEIRNPLISSGVPMLLKSSINSRLFVTNPSAFVFMAPRVFPG